MACGDIAHFSGEDGKDYYKYKKVVIGQEQGKLTEQKSEAKAKLSQQQLADFKKVVCSLKWSFGAVEKLSNAGQDWKPI